MKSRIEYLPADVFGLPPLARAVLAGSSPAPHACVPQTLPDLAPPEERFTPDERAALAETLEGRLAPLEPSVHVLDAVRSLAQRDVSVVLTSRPPGFLFAPFATLYAALHAVRLADSLATLWEHPVVPVLFNDADEHVLSRVHPAWIVNPNLDLRRIGLAGLPAVPRPCSRIDVTDGTAHLPAVRAALARLFEDCAHVDDALDLLLPRDGETLAGAFTRTALELLGHRGLVVVEPDWLRGELSRALAEVCGHDPVAATDPEPVEEATPPACVWNVAGDGGSQPLHAGGEGFRYPEEPGSRTPEELAAEIVQSPADFAPGRPLANLVQELCLPVAARVGDWSELALAADQGPLRAALELPPVPFVPRVACTLVDRGTRAALEASGGDLAAVLRAGGRFGAEREDGVPPAVLELREVAERATRELLDLRPGLAALDPSFRILARRTAGAVRAAIDELAGKAERVHANRTGKAGRHLRRLNHTLVPHGRPQEAVLGPIELLARHGRPAVDTLLDCIEALEVEHLVVELGDEVGEGA